MDAQTADILVVCTGNICRSPYIEHVLRAELDRAWGPGAVRVRSAGTRAEDGRQVSPPTDVRLRARGLDATAFGSRRVSADDVRGADLVLTATKAHRGEVVQLHPGALRRVFTFRELGLLAAELPEASLPATQHAGQWVREVTSTLAALRGQVPSTDIDIVDPYRRDDVVYDRMEQQVTDVLPWVLRALTGREASGGATAGGPVAAG